LNADTTQIWDGFHRRLRAFILGRVPDPADADDILQDVFVKLHTRLDTLRDEDRLTSWIYRVTRNAVVDHLRSRRPAMPVPDDRSAEAEPAGDDAFRQTAQFLRERMRTLPEKYRDALLLTEVEGLTQRQAADRLGLSLSGAKSRVQRARELLREQLLDCCHFELDRRRHIVGFVPRSRACPRCARDCATSGC
jgi:RNA polymerase sigma-70 factor (ECF subfamily)